LIIALDFSLSGAGLRTHWAIGILFTLTVPGVGKLHVHNLNVGGREGEEIRLAKDKSNITTCTIM